MRFDLRALLPAGEWTSVQIINQPQGMMADRGWAVLARAKRIRGGGKVAFIKFIVRAGAQAGRETQTFTGESRLADLYARLQRLQQMDDQIPVVPLLELQNMESGLLIAMEEVTPLKNIIDRGEAYDLSAKVLEIWTQTPMETAGCIWTSAPRT